MPSINDQIRDTEHQLQAATEDLQIADEKRLEIKAELRDAGQEILQLRFERMMMHAAVWHQKNFAKDPYWNIALAASISGVLVLLLLMSVAFRGASLPGFMIATLAAAGGFYALERRRGAGRPRITRNGAIALAIVGAFALMWLMFVFAASR